jgi:hypothetical protein
MSIPYFRMGNHHNSPAQQSSLERWKAIAQVEKLIEGETGMLTEKNDINALRRLQDDPPLRIQRRQQARKKAVSQFIVEAITASYERLLFKLLDQPRSHRFFIPRPRD